MKALVPVLFLVACGPERLAPPSQRAPGARDVSDSELVFAADWTEVATGALVAGTAVPVVYDETRLPRCRGMKYGQDAWGINAHYRIDGGEVRTTPVVGGLLELDASGELEVWFSNSDVWGCIDWDSDFGRNYRFEVVDASAVPDWMGNASSVVTRETCGGTFCDGALRPLSEGFVYDTWARQRAAVALLTFQVWEPGVTDWDNPDLWQQLDARVHWSSDPELVDAQWAWVDLHDFVGNDARYSVTLRSLDPLGGNTIVDPADCPTAPLRLSADGQYVETDLYVWFSVNGVELRPDDAPAWRGTFVDYEGLYAPCPR